MFEKTAYPLLQQPADRMPLCSTCIPKIYERDRGFQPPFLSLFECFSDKYAGQSWRWDWVTSCLTAPSPTQEVAPLPSHEPLLCGLPCVPPRQEDWWRPDSGQPILVSQEIIHYIDRWGECDMTYKPSSALSSPANQHSSARNIPKESRLLLWILLDTLQPKIRVKL